ncbi:acyl carrier protein [Streptomyces sp. NBC_01451]|uniref:acyl carrier protein n=1 Tax=Streptomyces sp. NBC_01451 TaxID=2903872 RepID=UPI002E3440C9|nr:acyl carrier protein [Streptomyces sp. NBC_01451]
MARRAAGFGTAEAGGLRRRLSTLSAAERTVLVEDLVRDKMVRVPRCVGVAAAETALVFRDLGLDSPTAVELRNQLNAANGLRLPATLAFDRPTPEGAAAFIAGKSAPPASAPPTPDPATDDETVRRRPTTGSPQRLRAAGLLEGLLRL